MARVMGSWNCNLLNFNEKN